MLFIALCWEILCKVHFPFCSTFTLEMLLLHTEKYAVGGHWMEEKKKKRYKIALSRLIMCMLKASDKPTSQDGCEKVERNAQSLPAQPELQITNWHTHWLIHIRGTHQKYFTHCRQRLQTQTTTARTSTAPDCHLTAKESARANQQSMKYICLWTYQQHLMPTHILTFTSSINTCSH